MLSTFAAMAVSAGAGAILGAGVWHLALRDRLKRDIVSALSSPDVATRLAAVEVAASHGVGRLAKALIQRVEVESDPAVVDAIATAVARGQWEPLTSPELAALRLWSQRRLGDSGSGRTVRSRTDVPGGPGGSANGAAPGGSAGLPSPVPAVGDGGDREMPPVAPLAARPVGVAGATSYGVGRAGDVGHASGNGNGNGTGTGKAGRVDAVTPVEKFPPWPGLTDVPPPPRPSTGADRPAAGPAGAAERSAAGTSFDPAAHGAGGSVVLVTDAGSAVGTLVVDALRRLGHRVVALAEPRSPRGDADRIPAVPVPPAGSPAFVDAVIDTACRVRATCVLAPTPLAIEALASAGRRLDDAGIRALLPAAGVVVDGRLARWNDHSLDRVAAAIAGGPAAPAAVRGFVAEAIVQAGTVLGAVVLEPGGAGTGQVGGTGPARAQAVHRPRVVQAIADAVAISGYVGPLHVRGGLAGDDAVWLSVVQPGFSPALELALTAGADLVGQWYAAVVGLPVDDDRLAYEDGPVHVSPRPQKAGTRAPDPDERPATGAPVRSGQ